MKSDSTASVSFSRVMGLPDAAALGWCISLGLLYVVGMPVFELSGSEAPLIYIVGAIIFLPIILSYAERASYAPRSGSPYEIARSGGSVPMVFATGWLILGGYICVGGLLTYAVVTRLSVGLQLFFNVTLEDYWLVMVVIGLSYINSVVALRGGVASPDHSGLGRLFDAPWPPCLVIFSSSAIRHPGSARKRTFQTLAQRSGPPRSRTLVYRPGFAAPRAAQTS